MKNKIFYGLNFLWNCFTAFTFPLCFGLIFICITGHSKGYDYDLGPEKDISIMFGCALLLIWLVLAMPSHIYIFCKTLKKGWLYLLIPFAVYILLATIGIFLFFGGWSEYCKEIFNI